MNDEVNPRGTEGIDWSAELQQHEPWLRNVIAARSGEPQAVDEILQELSLAVVKQQAPLRDSAKVAPWLYQIAVRQSLMYRRKHGRRRNLEQRFAHELESQTRNNATVNPLDWLIADERQKLIRQGIQQLSPKEAEILLLKYTQDWSYRQIAEHLGVSEAAVESRLHRARRNLRRQMITLNVVEAK